MIVVREGPHDETRHASIEFHEIQSTLTWDGNRFEWIGTCMERVGDMGELDEVRD